MTSLPAGYQPLNNAVKYLIEEQQKNLKNTDASNGTMILDYNKDGKFDIGDLFAKAQQLQGPMVPEAREKFKNEFTLAASTLFGQNFFTQNGNNNEKTAVSLFDYNKDSSLNYNDVIFKEREYTKTGDKTSKYQVDMLKAMSLPMVFDPPIPPKPPVDPNTQEWKPTPQQGRIDQVQYGQNTLIMAQYDAQNAFNKVDAELANVGPVGIPAPELLKRHKEAKAYLESTNKALAENISTNAPILSKGATPELNELFANILEYRRKSPDGYTGLNHKLFDTAWTMFVGFQDGVYPPKNDVKTMIKKLRDAATPIVDPPPPPPPWRPVSPPWTKLPIDINTPILQNPNLPVK
jgi:hypothetical protein